MKKYTFLFTALFFSQIAWAQTVINPTIKSKTTFAIVIDRESYTQAKAEVDAYKSSIEADGLGTYILAYDWKCPDDIRQRLISLHQSKTPLEGCVLVGDIPIPMIRDAHHLTSAFKMSPKADWQKSSVPSDRYYDDFSLKFDYIKRDSLKTDYYYYSLRADSRQYLSPDIYSARIRPLRIEGKDRYQMLREYLKKAVALKGTYNALDQLSMARGHGYNSEDYLAWSGEQMALREQLPMLFKSGGTAKFYDFDMNYPSKPLYLNEVQREGLDIMLFHHHGAPTTQYINGYKNGSGVELSIENVKLYLRSKVPSYAEKHGREAAVKKFAEDYGVPQQWCEEAFDPEKIKSDSLYNASMDIYTEDLRALRPNARFVMFDACYNGSFHMDDNVAGAYIFSKGNTLTVMGCTVNSIQDKWPDEFLGLMAAGMRIGEFARFTCFLENHLIGDPTLRFANTSGLNMDVDQTLVTKEGDVNFWKGQLYSKLPDMQSMALRQLSMCGYEGLPSLLKKSYYESDYFVVRLEALRLLTLNYPSEAFGVIRDAMNDSYELVRRYAVDYAEMNGNPEFIPSWIGSYLLRGHERRLHFRFFSGLGAFDPVLAQEELDRQLECLDLYDSTFVKEIQNGFSAQRESLKRDLATLNDPESTVKQLRLELSIFRNKPYYYGIDPLLNVLKDENKDEELRLAAAEALGWYNLYYKKGDIISELKSFQTSNAKLSSEVTKTINRLSGKNR